MNNQFKAYRWDSTSNGKTSLNKFVTVMTHNKYKHLIFIRIQKKSITETLLTPRIYYTKVYDYFDGFHENISISTPLKSLNRTKGTRETPFACKANVHPTEEGDVEKNAYL